MSDPKFNSLVFLKGFNNYFNRKLVGGSNFSNYVRGESGSSVQASITINGSIDEYVEVSEDVYRFNKNIECLAGTKLVGGDFIISYIQGDCSANVESFNPITQDIEIEVSLQPGETIENVIIFVSANENQYVYERRDNVNFNPNDGLTTEIVINDILDFEPDYLLVLDHDVIVSRWYVIEIQRTRGSQAKFSIRRDVIYDYLEDLMDAPIYVHKGMLPEDDPFVLNDEGMSLNQIKTDEIKLSDYSEVPWIVIYYAKNATTATINTNGFNFTFPISNHRALLGEEYDAIAIPYGDIDIHIDENTVYHSYKAYAKTIAQEIALALGDACYDIQLLPYCPEQEALSKYQPDFYCKWLSSFPGSKDKFNNLSRTASSGSKTIVLRTNDFEEIEEEPGKFIYRATFSSGDFGIDQKCTLSNIGVSMSIESDITDSPSGVDAITFNTKKLEIELHDADYYHLTNITYIITYDVSTSGAANALFILNVENSSFKVNIKKYELRVVPHPESKKIMSNCYLYRLVSPNYQGSFDFNVGKNGNEGLDDIQVYCTYKPYTPLIKAAPTFDLLYGKNYKDNRGLICGGDFSLTRISSAWVSYQLQNKNYQNIFNREIQNLDFNQNVAMRETVVAGAIGVAQGALYGGAAGSMMGGWSTIGSVIGGAAGAVTGAAISATASAADIGFLAERQKEERSYAIDKYNYQIGNIKAIPNTLTKVGSFDAISKYFPILEIYTCTDKELEAFINKIKYESMTVMRIDTMRYYYHKFNELCYFKGELIRNDMIACDYHILMAIFDELMRGVFL